MAAKVFRVAVENITPLWPQLEPLVAKALATRATHVPEDVRAILLGQQSLLWATMTGGTLDAFVITDFAVWPQGVWLRGWLAAARDDVKFPAEEFRSTVLDFAKANKCRGFEGGGRVGWLRMFPQLAFEGVWGRLTFDAES